MGLLPIIDRELCVAARRGKNYWLRVAAALAAAVICGWIVLWSGRALPPAMLGRTLFAYLSVLAFAFCLLVGPFITADCLSEEKRDGTLGLLFLTELSSYHVVLGKWIATALTGLYGLLAILPALGLPLLLGGVTPGEFGRVALAVVNAIVFSLTAGMFVSVLSREQTKATLGSVILILGLTGLVPGLFVFFATGVLGIAVNQLPPLALVSPAYTGYLAMDASYKTAPQLYWTSLALVHGLTWAFMVATALMLPRVWREDPSEKPVLHRWWLRFGYTRGWKRAFRRRLDKNPVFAASARQRWPHFVFWTLVILVAINVYWIAVGSRKNPAAYQFHQNFAYALIFTNRVWVTVMACHFFLEDRRTGALELLLTTPLPVRTLLRGHRRSLWQYFFWPIFVIGLLHVAYVVANWQSTRHQAAVGASILAYYVISAANSYVSFLTDVFALCAVGAWLSLSLRKAGLALLLTFTFVILIPWSLGFYLQNVSSLLPARLVTWLQNLPWVQTLLPGGLYGSALGRTAAGVLKNLVFMLWAARQLRRHFRTAAAGTLRGTGRSGSNRGRWWRKKDGRASMPAVGEAAGPA